MAVSLGIELEAVVLDSGTDLDANLSRRDLGSI